MKEPAVDPLASAPVADATAGAPATPAATPASTAFADGRVSFPFNVMEIIPGETATWVSIAGQDTDELARAIYRIDRGATAAEVVVEAIGADANSVSAFVEAGGSLWVVTLEGGAEKAIRFSVADGTRLGEIELGNFPIEPHVGFGAVWSLNYDDGALSRIDPSSGNVDATIVIEQFAGQGPRDVAAGATLLWAITPRQDTMVGIDPDTNDIAVEVALAARLHCGVAVMAGRVWVGGCDATAPLQVFDDPQGGELGEVAGLPSVGLPLLEANGVVWVPTVEDVEPRTTKLVAIDVATLQPADLPSVDLGVVTGPLVVDDGSIWYAAGGAEVFRLSLDSFPTS